MIQPDTIPDNKTTEVISFPEIMLIKKVKKFFKSKLLRLGRSFANIEEVNRRKIREDEFIEALQLLGVKKGSVLFLHISLNNLALSVTDIVWLFGAIWKVVGEDGTIVLPTFTYKQFKMPNYCFNVNKTRSDLGWASEYFRCQPGVVRSVHPTHSVAAKGKFAFEITRYHRESITPFGRNTPYDILYQKDAIILFLGKSPTINSFYHAIEEWGNMPELYEEKIHRIKILDVKEEYYTCTKIHRLHWHRRSIERLLIKRGILRRCDKFKDFKLYAASSKELVDFLLSKQNKNRYFLSGNIYQLISDICLGIIINLYAFVFRDLKYKRKLRIIERVKFQVKKYI